MLRADGDDPKWISSNICIKRFNLNFSFIYFCIVNVSQNLLLIILVSKNNVFNFFKFFLKRLWEIKIKDMAGTFIFDEKRWHLDGYLLLLSALSSLSYQKLRSLKNYGRLWFQTQLILSIVLIYCQTFQNAYLVLFIKPISPWGTLCIQDSLTHNGPPKIMDKPQKSYFTAAI